MADDTGRTLGTPSAPATGRLSPADSSAPRARHVADEAAFRKNIQDVIRALEQTTRAAELATWRAAGKSEADFAESWPRIWKDVYLARFATIFGQELADMRPPAPSASASKVRF